MAFPGYLTLQEVQQLVLAAVEAQLFAVPRATLLQGLPGAFVASLPLFPSPLDQFQADLAALNRTERLADGLVPLDTFLMNAVFQLRLVSRPEATVFAGVQSRVKNAAVGTPPMPPVAEVPEIKLNEQIVAEDDSLDIAFLARGAELARAVARIAVPRFENGLQVMLPNGSPWVMLGTAWLLAADLAITNRHVINARRQGEAPASEADLGRQAQAATMEFGFDTADATTTSATVGRLVATSAALDYALLEIAGGQAAAVPRLRRQPVVVGATSRLAVNIVQHPGGRPKQVALRNNLVSAATADEIRYFTDTDYGSSGSPVCDDQWRVVALHRGSVHAPNTSYQGRTEAYVNYGSQIGAVLADIGTAAPAEAARIAAAQPAEG
jgi:V8-like Glu-specific endopeptidase